MSRTTLRPTKDIRRWSPFRGPAWRWDLALEHIQSGTDPESREDSGSYTQQTGPEAKETLKVCDTKLGSNGGRITDYEHQNVDHA